MPTTMKRSAMAELLPLRKRAVPARPRHDSDRKEVRPASPRLPLHFYRIPSTSADAIAEAILREYGSVRQKNGSGKLRSPLGPLFGKLAAKTAGPRLGGQELAQLMVETPPQLEISFQLFDQRHGRPRVAVKAAAQPPAFEWQQSSADAGTLVVERPQGGSLRQTDARATGDMASFYALRFHIVDQDKNNYLDRQGIRGSRPAGGGLRRRRRQRRRADRGAGTVRLSSKKGELYVTRS